MRDELLGREPDDFDVATDATPDRIAGLFPRTNEVGAHFGVVLVRRGAITVEVATFRADGDYSDRRRPDSVRFSNATEDARRRDFTVNALFLDPLGKHDESSEPDAVVVPAPSGGVVIDLVKGLKDLDARLIRAVGDPDKRLAEDDLRALRAARLAAKLGFAIHSATADAIRRHAADLQGVSRERIGDEVRKMMEHPARAHAAIHLQSLQLVSPVLRERFEADSTVHLGGLPPSARAVLGLAAWGLDLGVLDPADSHWPRRVARAWRDALMLSNAEHESLQACWELLGAVEQSWLQEPVARAKRIAAKPEFQDALALLAIRDPVRHLAAQSRLHGLSQHAGGIAPEPIVNGAHLIAWGWKPGPSFKRMLDSLYDAQLEGRLEHPDQGRELLAAIGVPPG